MLLQQMIKEKGLLSVEQAKNLFHKISEHQKQITKKNNNKKKGRLFEGLHYISPWQQFQNKDSERNLDRYISTQNDVKKIEPQKVDSFLSQVKNHSYKKKSHLNVEEVSQKTFALPEFKEDIKNLMGQEEKYMPNIGFGFIKYTGKNKKKSQNLSSKQTQLQQQTIESKINSNQQRLQKKISIKKLSIPLNQQQNSIENTENMIKSNNKYKQQQLTKNSIFANKNRKKNQVKIIDLNNSSTQHQNFQDTLEAQKRINPFSKTLKINHQKCMNNNLTLTSLRCHTDNIVNKRDRISERYYQLFSETNSQKKKISLNAKLLRKKIKTLPVV